MQYVDHVLILLLFVAQPIHGALASRYYLDRVAAGEPLPRTRFYRETAVVEWLFLALLLAAWFDFGRPLADLGFVMATGPGFWFGAAVCIAMTLYLVHAWRGALRASEEDKASVAGSFGDLIHYLPRTRRELNNFYVVSITAGIVEEIVYRGFVIWYLGHVMPVWAAVVVSSVAFGLGHSYQGASGALRVTLVGLAFGALYVISGSIWLPILAHILLDVLQGGAIHAILSEDRGGLEPDPA